MKYILVCLGMITLHGFMSCTDLETEKPEDIDPVSNQQIYTIPIVCVHGALASGDTWSKWAMHLTSNDYPQELIYAFDWNTLGANLDNSAQDLDVFIDSILNETQQDKVILIGHSMGGSLGYTYCNDANRQDKIYKYIHVGSNPQDLPAGKDGTIPTLNIYSTDDLIVTGKDIPMATNVVLTGLDHYQVATSSISCQKMFDFIKPKESLTFKTDITHVNSEISISGRVVSLGENMFNNDYSVKIYAVDSMTGQRITQGESISIDNRGYFKNIEVQPDVHYEFEVTPHLAGLRAVYYFRKPFVRNNPFVYLRTLPAPSSIAGLLLAGLPSDDNQTVAAVFSANQAVIHARDQLFVDGNELSLPAFTSAAQSTIAIFLYDNGDEVSSLIGHQAFSFLPFLKGIDIYLPSEDALPIKIQLNDKTLNLRKTNSMTEGIVIGVIE